MFSFFHFLFLTNNSKQAKHPASVLRNAGRFAFAGLTGGAHRLRGISMGLGIAPTRFTVPEFPAGNDRAGRNFTPVSLDFLGRTCYNQRSFILTKAMMRTNRSLFPMTQRGLPRIPGAASSLPCIGLLPPQRAAENLCRVRPLQHSEWRVLKGTQFGWNRGTREIFRRFIP